MKNKRDLLFLIIGVSLFCILMVVAFYSISFLIAKMNTALNVDVRNSDKLVRVNLESLKNIQIVEEVRNETE